MEIRNYGKLVRQILIRKSLSSKIVCDSIVYNYLEQNIFSSAEGEKQGSIFQYGKEAGLWFQDVLFSRSAVELCL